MKYKTSFISKINIAAPFKNRYFPRKFTESADKEPKQRNKSLVETQLRRTDTVAIYDI